MRFWFRGAPAAGLAALILAACATTRSFYPPQRAYEGARPREVRPAAPLVSDRDNAFSQLAGWAQDDHAAALRAFQAACLARRAGRFIDVCGRAIALGAVDEVSARAFFQANFRPEPVAEPGLLTAYFSPVYEARRQKGGVFTAPVRPRPVDLPGTDWSAQSNSPYEERAAIEASAAPDALAWMRPEDLFFLQIQGSGVLVFEDRTRLKALFAGANGAPFVAIARPMIRKGILPAHSASAEAIRRWLADNRGDAAEAMMQLDPRYVFFRLAPDDGEDPAGAAGAPLIPGRSVAVDLSWHALGELLWIDASAPTLSGAFPNYRRLAVAMDAGGAIKGDARADLYLGRGAAAGDEAGRVRHVLHLWRLEPIGTP
jgi:membrane-bound lytic murein transglycosylase A